MKIKIVYTAILALFFSLCSFGQNDWKNLKLKANVKSLKVIDYNVIEHFGKVKKIDVLRGENVLFSESGFVTIKKRYGVNAEPIDQASFVYDEHNSIVEQNVSDKKGKLISRLTSEYNVDNKKSYDSSYKFDGSLQSRAAYSYSNHTQLKEIVTFDSKGDKKDLQVFDYHKRKLTKVVTKIHPKSKVRSSSQKYDKHNNLLESNVYDVMGDIKTKLTFKYDENNNVVESKFFEIEELVIKRKLEYNNLGFLAVEKVSYPLKDKTDIITYSYDFDAKVNWVQMIKYLNSVPIKMSERTIVYFN